MVEPVDNQECDMNNIMMGENNEPTERTILFVAISALIFLVSAGFAIYLLVKFLIINGKCRRKMMVLFYIAAILDLLTRLA